MKSIPTMSVSEDHKILKFRDTHAKISRILITISVGIFLVAVVMMTISLKHSLERQAEMTRLIGLAEAQGGDITAARQIYDTIQKVSKLTKLPENEIPIFATITDIAKIQAQPLFKEAMNGDQILFYSKSQWIYVYRPQANRIVTQGPFALPSPPVHTPTIVVPTIATSSSTGKVPQTSPLSSPEADITNP